MRRPGSGAPSPRRGFCSPVEPRAGPPTGLRTAGWAVPFTPFLAGEVGRTEEPSGTLSASWVRVFGPLLASPHFLGRKAKGIM